MEKSHLCPCSHVWWKGTLPEQGKFRLAVNQDPTGCRNGELFASSWGGILLRRESLTLASVFSNALV